MTISIIGGIEHLKEHYENTMKKKGHKMKFIAENKRNFFNHVGNVNGIIIFTREVSHNAMWSALKYAKAFNIPTVRSKTSSISGLKRSIDLIENQCACYK